MICPHCKNLIDSPQHELGCDVEAMKAEVQYKDSFLFKIPRVKIIRDPMGHISFLHSNDYYIKQYKQGEENK